MAKGKAVYITAAIVVRIRGWNINIIEYNLKWEDICV